MVVQVPALDEHEIGEDGGDRLGFVESHAARLAERMECGRNGDLRQHEEHEHDEMNGIDASEPLDQEIEKLRDSSKI